MLVLELVLQVFLRLVAACPDQVVILLPSIPPASRFIGFIDRWRGVYRLLEWQTTLLNSHVFFSLLFLLLCFSNVVPEL